MKKVMKPGTLLSPVPAVLVTSADESKDNIITIAWTGIINSKPPMTYVSVTKERYSHHIIESSREFAINLVSEDMVKAADFCGVRSGRKFDKFKECGLTREKGKHISAPIIAESPLSLECKVKDIIELGSHDMFVAEIVAVQADESLFDEKGRLCLDKANLIAYSHGEYFELKRHPIYKFGYSVMKRKTKKRINKELNARKREKKGFDK